MLGIRREELLELREELISTFEPTIKSNEYLNKQEFIRESLDSHLALIEFCCWLKGDWLKIQSLNSFFIDRA